MEQLHVTNHGSRSPLERARTQEKIATYSIALIVGFVVVLIVRAVTFAGTQPPGDQARIMSTIITIAQFLVTLATLAVVRHQVRVAVNQIEQSEAGEVRQQILAHAIGELVDAIGSRDGLRAVR
ncbi:MAG TPA: hypothetical protein VGU66_10825 [Candidatus Elarobacter sp.]|nr:hypothetical protein [Candidatus Elarobacter sp.]